MMEIASVRKFGFIFLLYYAAIVSILLLRHHAISLTVWIVFGAFFACVLLKPELLKPVRWLWDGILSILRYVNTRLLLGFLFYGIFTPIALIRKMLQQDALHLQYDPDCASYRVLTQEMHNDLRRSF